MVDGEDGDEVATYEDVVGPAIQAVLKADGDKLGARSYWLAATGCNSKYYSL